MKISIRFLAAAFLPALLSFSASAGPAPAPVYSTVVAGYNIPAVRDLAVDAAGNAFLLARTIGFSQREELLAIKFDPAGNPVWTRHVTASNSIYGMGVALDPSGDLWIAGWTLAADLPLVTPLDATLDGGKDAFLMRLSGADGTIAFSTYFGGEGGDDFNDIVIDANGQVLVAGSTSSDAYPVTPDALQSQHSFPQSSFADAVLTRFSPAGDAVLYSTYLGGLNHDRARRIALDQQGNIIIAGSTASTDFPLVAPFQTTPDDIFVARLLPDGSALSFSTYLGGEDLDYVDGLATDASGRLYLTGSTRSEGFPTTAGAYTETFVGAILGCEVPFGQDHNCEDMFVTVLDPAEGNLVWSTYLGGTQVETARGVVSGPSGSATVIGYSGSADYPLLDSAFGANIVVSRLSANGSILDFTFSVESGSANRGNGIATDAAGNIYIAGTVGVPASLVVSKLDTEQASGLPRAEAGLVEELRNYPNPFNPRTVIAFDLARPATATLSIHDARGRLVSILADHLALPAGRQEFPWSGRDRSGRRLPSGVFFYRLEAGDQTAIGRMVLLQ